VQGSTAVILLNFCAKNPPHRQAENRYMLCLAKHTAEKPTQKFILFLPNFFCQRSLAHFAFFPKRKPTQKMQKELIFPTLKIQ